MAKKRMTPKPADPPPAKEPATKKRLPDGRVAPGRGPKKGAPNAGRPPSVIRAMFRESLAQRLIFLQQVADGKPFDVTLPNGKPIPVISSMDARLRAVDMMGKYGIGQASTVLDKDGETVRPWVVVLPPQEPDTP